MVHGNVEFWSIWDTGRISLMPQTNVIDSHSTDQFSKASLGLVVDVAYPLIDSFLALLQHLFVYLRVSKPVEDLCKQDIVNMVSRMVQSRVRSSCRAEHTSSPPLGEETIAASATAVNCVCQGPSASSFASFEALLRPLRSSSFLLVLQPSRLQLSAKLSSVT